jgi:hypothetical protein
MSPKRLLYAVFLSASIAAASVHAQTAEPTPEPAPDTPAAPAIEPAPAAPAAPKVSSEPIGPVQNIVLVHGAFVDGSSWNGVIARLQKKGYHVASAQIPLTSLADDVAATKRVLAQQSGPTILVGHRGAAS